MCKSQWRLESTVQASLTEMVTLCAGQALCKVGKGREGMLVPGGGSDWGQAGVLQCPVTSHRISSASATSALLRWADTTATNAFINYSSTAHRNILSHINNTGLSFLHIGISMHYPTPSPSHLQVTLATVSLYFVTMACGGVWEGDLWWQHVEVPGGEPASLHLCWGLAAAPPSKTH